MADGRSLKRLAGFALFTLTDLDFRSKTAFLGGGCESKNISALSCCQSLSFRCFFVRPKSPILCGGDRSLDAVFFTKNPMEFLFGRISLTFKDQDFLLQFLRSSFFWMVRGLPRMV